MPKVYRVCHIGVGRMGSHRQQIFREVPQIDCVAIVDPFINIEKYNEERITKNQRVVPIYRSLDKVKEPYDFIWISCPTAAHAEAIKSAATHTKLIMCEKPIAPTRKLVSECYDVCEKNGTALICCWMRKFDVHYDHLYRKMNDFLSGGDESREIIGGHFVSLDYPDVPEEFLKTLGTIFVDLMCHDFNLLTMFFKERPVRLRAGSVSTRGAVHDTAWCLVEYPGKHIVKLEASRYSTKEKRHMCKARLYTNDSVSPLLSCGERVHCNSYQERFHDAFCEEVKWVLKLLDKINEGKSSTESVDPQYPPSWPNGVSTHSDLLRLCASARRGCELTATLVELAEKSDETGKEVDVPSELEEKTGRKPKL